MNIETAFAADGPLATAIPGFSPRPQQLEMAERIAAALKQNGVLVAEAGTGTGKTYAYLVPALLNGGKVIISTGTKTLQDQLFNRDLPTIRGALKVPVAVALLKGRANYVCHYHLARNLVDGRFQTPEDAGYVRAIGRFMEITQSGDKAECPEVPEDAFAWQFATSSRDNCLGQECPNIKECFVAAARRAAMDADVVVVGIGSRPSTDWLEGSGIAVDNGIVCDNVGRTSAEHVWALGDVASWRDATGHQARVEHWSNVAEQARVLVPSMFGQDAPESVVVPYFWSDQYDVKIQCLGEPEADDVVHVVEDDGRKFLAYYERDGVLVGVVGGGMPGKVMKARAKIASGAPISDILG